MALLISQPPEFVSNGQGDQFPGLALGAITGQWRRKLQLPPEALRSLVLPARKQLASNDTASAIKPGASTVKVND